MLVQSFIPELYELLGFKAYSKINNQEDFNIVFACIATGVISGYGYSIMLKKFSASGGTYGISALIKKAKPETNIAYISFILDANSSDESSEMNIAISAGSKVVKYFFSSI